MSHLRRGGAAVVLAVGLGAMLLGLPALAAGGWWAGAPGSSPRLSLVASNQGSVTLAVSRGAPGWYRPGTGQFIPLMLSQSRSGAEAVAVAATGRLGVVAFAGGRLLETVRGGSTRWLPSLLGEPRDLALGPGANPRLAAATSAGVFSGRLGSRLAKVAPGTGRAVLAPPRRGLPWLALARGRLLASSDAARWTPAAGSPRFAAATAELAELGSGVILLAEPSGLLWRGYRGRWAPAFQLLPEGGLGGVPRVTALVADGVDSAYLGTAGFGTLLTPDGGYTWYRAAPPDAEVTALAALGRVFAEHPHGLVIAVTPQRIYLHRLQALPAPPVYTPAGATAELAGTAAVAGAAALVVVSLLWYLERRRRHLFV
ncbi:MAG: hypothetical protein ACREN1_06985 [Candidatus Dormibacteria bacterium]